MPTVKFHLKDSKSENTTPIVLYINHLGHRIKIYSGLSITPKYWNAKKSRVKELIEFSEHEYLNTQLDEMEAKINRLIAFYSSQEIHLTADRIKRDFNTEFENPLKKAAKAKTLWAFFDEFVLYKKKQLGDVRDYDNSLRKHLLVGEKYFGQALTFSALKENGGFVEQWDKYLTFEAVNAQGDFGLTTNTIGKQHKNLKVFLNWCFDNNHYSRFHLKHLPTITEDVEKIYLTEEELCKLEAVSLSTTDEKIVRDLFLIGCETALRFSDFTRLHSDNYIAGQLHFHPKKTSSQVINNKVIIPVSQRHQRILDAYNGIPPNFDGNRVSEFNKIIREVARKAGITEQQKTYKRIAEKTTAVFTPRYEEISSHTCRRTFCTLKFLKGMNIQAIMKFSGHRTERNFMKYLKLDAQIAADKYKEFF